MKVAARKALTRKALAVLCWPWAKLRNMLFPGIRILMYHRVDDLPEYDQLTVSTRRFREQMRILSASYRVIPMSLALQELALGCPIRNTVVITFDDGYRDNLVNALPVIRELKLPATVFVTTGFANGTTHHPRYEDGQGLHMSWRELRQWLHVPGNELGAHSRTHPRLGELQDASCRYEIAECMKDFVNAGMPHNGVFCYPCGDVSEREAGLARDSGYRAAVTVSPGLNRLQTDRFLLKRTEITDRDDPFAFRLKLDGAFDALHAWLHRRRMRGFARAAKTTREVEG